MVSTEELSRLLATLYAAPLQPEKWQIFFNQLSVLTKISSGYLITGSPRLGQEILAGGGLYFNPELLRSYNEYYFQHDPYWPPFLRNPRARVIRGVELVSHDRLVRTELYNDILVKNDMESMTLLSCSLMKDQVDVMPVWRSSQDGPMEDSSIELLETLLPHAQLALQMRRRLAASDALGHFAEMALDAIQIPVLLVGSTGNIRHMSKTAAAILHKADGLISSGATLAAAESGEDERLRHLIAKAASANKSQDASSSGGAMMITRYQSMSPLHLSVLPVPENLTTAVASPHALVFLSDPSAPERSRAPIMQALYSLTPAESRLADRLLQGLELRDAADHLGVTIETARFHLKRVLSKTGTHRQSNLIRLMLSLPGQS